MKRVGENCAACNRWVPSFVRTCSQCGLPSTRAQVENLGRFLSGEGASTCPNRRKQRAEVPKKPAPATLALAAPCAREAPEPSAYKLYNMKQIRERLAAGVRPAHLARELGVSPATVGRMQKRMANGQG